MDSLNEFPKIMAQARIDLAGNVAGQFSPADWELILAEARLRLERQRAAGSTHPWENVIREFHLERFWGFTPEWRPPPKPKIKNKNLGLAFVWMVFSTFVITLIAVVWLGQNFTASDEPKDKYLFFGALALVISNFVYFLWRARHYED